MLININKKIYKEIYRELMIQIKNLTYKALVEAINEEYIDRI